MNEEKTLDEELAPLLEALKQLEAARAKLSAFAHERTKRASAPGKMLYMPLEYFAPLSMLIHSGVTIENLKESLEQAFAEDLRAVGYRRPVGDKRNGIR